MLWEKYGGCFHSRACTWGGEYTFAVGKSFLLGRGRPSANISFGEKILTGNAMAIATLKHDGFTLIRVETTIQTEIPPQISVFAETCAGAVSLVGQLWLLQSPTTPFSPK